MPDVPKAPARKPEPAEVRAARKAVADAASALARVWSNAQERPDAQAKLTKAQAALTGALSRAGLPTH